MFQTTNQVVSSPQFGQWDKYGNYILNIWILKYTNRYFRLPPGPRGLARPPHI